MSYRDRDDYIDPYYSGVAEAIRERDHVNMFLPRDIREKPEPSPGHCPIHNARYIDYSSGSNDLRCPLCGYKKPVEVIEKPKVEEQQEQQQKIKKKNPVKGKKTFAMSQNIRDNKKAKSPGQIEIEKELGGRSQVSSYEEWDL